MLNKHEFSNIKLPKHYLLSVIVK